VVQIDPPVLESRDVTAPQPSTAQLLYTALSDCANLHPDPASPGSGEEDGGAQPNIIFEGDAEAPFSTLNNTADGQQTALPPAMPGRGGWITAENVNEYFDEEGNWRGAGERLGEGAGSVRRREEDDGEVNGHGGAEEIEGEETKWRRTD
jgi:nucleotide-sensitive chloride channel 1A